MAKTSEGGVNRSEAIRQYLSGHSDASTKEVIAALGQQGIEVSEALVSNVKFNLKAKQKGGKKKIAKKSTPAAAGTPERGARSQAIRDYLAQQPKASPKEVVAGLQAQGIEVKEGLVSAIKYGKPGKKKAGRKKLVRAVAGAPAVKPKATGLTLENLLEVKALADRLGGFEQARQALDALEQLR